METLASAHLGVFFVMVLGIIVMPGMDMAFVLASALSGGRRAGAFAVAGIVFGGLCHTAAGALGFGLVFKLVPGLINAMLAIGALYIAWIGCSLLRAQPAAEAVATESLALPASPAAMAALPPFRPQTERELFIPRLGLSGPVPIVNIPLRNRTWDVRDLGQNITAVIDQGSESGLDGPNRSRAGKQAGRPDLACEDLRRGGIHRKARDGRRRRRVPQGGFGT